VATASTQSVTNERKREKSFDDREERENLIRPIPVGRSTKDSKTNYYSRCIKRGKRGTVKKMKSGKVHHIKVEDSLDFSWRIQRAGKAGMPDYGL